MFILETTPTFVWVLIPVFAALSAVSIVLMGSSIAAGLEGKIGSKAKNTASIALSAIVLAVSLPGFCFVMVQDNSIETFNNPYSASDEQRSELRLDTSEVEKTIAEALNIDKAEVEAVTEVGRKARNGDMVDFTAVEEGKLIEGKFYFTETTLEILVSGETDIIEHVSISTK